MHYSHQLFNFYCNFGASFQTLQLINFKNIDYEEVIINVSSTNLE